MRTLLKWLVITIIVLMLFLIVLLGLGYLLKENEEVTNQLKIKLTQEAQLKQEKEARRKALFRIKPTHLLKQELTVFEQSQQRIITDNSSCETKKECFLVHTNSQALGCIAVVNSTGIAILLKTASELNEPKLPTNECRQTYSQETLLTLSCQSNTCLFTR
jgi:hypothetical protein